MPCSEIFLHYDCHGWFLLGKHMQFILVNTQRVLGDFRVIASLPCNCLLIERWAGYIQSLSNWPFINVCWRPRHSCDGVMDWQNWANITYQSQPNSRISLWTCQIIHAILSTSKYYGERKWNKIYIQILNSKYTQFPHNITLGTLFHIWKLIIWWPILCCWVKPPWSNIVLQTSLQVCHQMKILIWFSNWEPAHTKGPIEYTFCNHSVMVSMKSVYPFHRWYTFIYINMGRNEAFSECN